MPRTPVVQSQQPNDDDRQRDAALRPRWLGEGLNARTIALKLKPFTLIGATTRSGMLSSPMRDRFKMHEHLEFYSVAELATILQVNAHKLQTPITEEAAHEMA